MLTKFSTPELTIHLDGDICHGQRRYTVASAKHKLVLETNELFGSYSPGAAGEGWSWTALESEIRAKQRWAELTGEVLPLPDFVPVKHVKFVFDGGKLRITVYANGVEVDDETFSYKNVYNIYKALTEERLRGRYVKHNAIAALLGQEVITPTIEIEEIKP